MYRMLFFSVFLMFLLFKNTQSQPNLTYELTSSEKCAHVTNGINKQILSPSSLDWYLGTYQGDRRRGFFQWSLPDNVIPDGSTINSARLYMHVSPFGHSYEMNAVLYGMELDLDQATAQLLWQRSDWFNNQTEYHIGFATSTNYTVDETFSSGSDFTNAIETALSDDFFTLGVVELRETSHQYPFRLIGLDVKLEIHYTPPSQQVLVDQKRFDNITSIGSVGRWEGGPEFEPYAVPYQFTFYLQTSEVLQATQDFAYDPVEKYYHWENYDDITNHHIFDIMPYLTELSAKLNKTYETVIIENNFTSAPGANPPDDIIEFKDPWFIDYPDPEYEDNLRNRG